jgi:hypothetical protein
MMPSAYMLVRCMLLTRLFNIDRSRLRRMASSISREQLLALVKARFPEPQAVSLKPLPLTVVEKEMRSSWAKVLGRDEALIARNAGFRKLGGNIVLCKQLVIACWQRGIEISVNDVLFDFTLIQLCRGVSTSPTYSSCLGTRLSRSWRGTYAGGSDGWYCCTATQLGRWNDWGCRRGFAPSDHVCRVWNTSRQWGCWLPNG